VEVKSLKLRVLRDLSGILAWGVVACAGDGTGLDDLGNPIGEGPPPAVEVTLSGHVQPIFTESCALSDCHAGAQAPQGQNLSEGQAFANIVNVASGELPSMNRVTPGDPETSYLVHKIQGTQATVGGSGGRMPLGTGALPQSEIDVIRAWIADGAKNN
jgi:hypothetical protein